MKQQSRFTGNISSDLDVSAIKPDQIVFPTIGIRIFNKDGQGLIATLLPGNIEYFSLTDGFTLIGGVEYNGVGYIVSLNESTGEGEIGTFPSPILTGPGFTNTYSPLINLDPILAGNLATQPPKPLRTLLFNFNIHHPVDVVAKKSFDNSVDLYFIDFYNPDRVINTGFDITGVRVNRYVYSSNFNGVINHIPFSGQEIKCNSATVSSGGFWKPGNVFLYIRYLTADYASTNFVKEIGPVSISYGDTLFSHVGFQEKDWSTGEDKVTDRKITLNLTNLDTNFKYMQVGVIRYTATTENGPAQQDIWLIDNYYPVSGSSKIINIYGNEPSSLLNFKEILQTPFPYPISKSQTQLVNRLLKANFKRGNLDYKRADLIAFASKVQVGEFYYKGDFATKPISYFSDDNGLLFYSKADDVYNYLGYFKEQIYPFAVVFKFTDGTLSEAFPVKGNLGQSEEKGLYQFKDWTHACSDALAQNIITTTPDQNLVSGVSFNTLQAKQYWINNPTGFTSVEGFMFVRAERIDNIICQGVIMHGYHGVRIDRTVGVDPQSRWCSFNGELGIDQGTPADNTTAWNPQTAAVMPLLRGYMPISHADDTNNFYYGYCDDNNLPVSLNFPDPNSRYLRNGYDGYDGIASPNIHLTYPPRSASVFGTQPYPGMFTSLAPHDNKHGIFSPDILLDSGSIVIQDGAYYVKPLFRFRHITGSNGGGMETAFPPPYVTYFGYSSRSLYPGITSIDFDQSKGVVNCSTANYGDITQEYATVKAAKVAHLQGKGDLNFSGHFSANPQDTDYGFDAMSHVYNRDIGTCGYIGVEDIDTGKSLRWLYTDRRYPATIQPEIEHMCIVNLYKNKMDATFKTAINDSFNISMTQYAPISELIQLSDTGTGGPPPVFEIYKGDCFLQKVWIRTHRWYAMFQNNDHNLPLYGQTTAFGAEFVDSNGYWYQHGLMVGMTVECRYNAGMRNEVIGSNSGTQYLKYSYFPKVMQDRIDPEQWIAMEPGKYAQEATQVNAGYDKVLSDKTVKGFESTEPAFEQNKPNRVYASDAHIAGSFLDGYRSIQQNSYQDFALEDGDINYIGKNLTYVFIVHRNGINQIFVNEQAMAQTSDGQNVIMGTSLTFFSDKVKKLAWFGTQHKLSIVNGSKGTYGFDFLNAAWWFINTFQLQSGLQELRVTDLSAEQMIFDELEKMMNLYNPNRDVMGELPDDPLSGIGIVGFADIDNEEVGMTFMLPTGTGGSAPISGLGGLLRTIVYSEKIMGFRGDYPFAERLYFNIGNMLLSQHAALTGGVSQTSKVYLYNQKQDANGDPNYMTFFSDLREANLSFIVNGNSEKENTAAIEKVFNAIEFEMNNVVIKQIIFTTKYQSGSYSGAATEVWKTAEYIGHKLHVPIVIQEPPDDVQYLTDSEMSGTWMKVTMVFYLNTDIELKAAETDFDLIAQ